jgi:2-amino-4-hydroxy-6-hydroxymethyldihydropteridine diphosphokinase
MSNIYLSLGSNQGEKLKNLQNAVDQIALKIGTLQNIAAIYKTPALGFDGHDFLNTCLKVTTSLLPNQLLSELLNIEALLGRKRDISTQKYANRIIDIDLLLFENTIISSKELTIPHPRMLARKFVLEPLVEIAPNTIHPIEKLPLHACLKKCTDASEVTVISDTLKG